MTAFLTGGSRGIGRAIKESLEKSGISVIAPTRIELDLSNPDSIKVYHAWNSRIWKSYMGNYS